MAQLFVVLQNKGIMKKDRKQKFALAIEEELANCMKDMIISDDSDMEMARKASARFNMLAQAIYNILTSDLV